MIRRVIALDPICRGFEHVTANAAVLLTLRHAFPEAHLSLLGEKQHIGWVQGEMERAEPGTRAVDLYQPTWIPKNTFWGARRILYELRWCRTLLREAYAREADALVLLSLSHTGLIALKLVMHCARVRLPVVAIMHSVLGDVTLRPPRLPWNRAVRIRNALDLRHPPGLRLVALGASIHRELARIEPRWAPHFRVMDLPYCFPPVADTETLSAQGPVRFGCFGVVSATKGFPAYHALAEDAARVSDRSEWLLVGFFRDDPAYARRYAGPIRGIQTSPLTPAEYHARAGAITYAVQLADPDKYRLIASASFLDALAYAKPAICLRNPYAEECFRKMGDIGYLCDTQDDVRATVRAILHEPPVDRYRQQRQTMIEGRRIFAPVTVAPTLRRIFEE